MRYNWRPVNTQVPCFVCSGDLSGSDYLGKEVEIGGDLFVVRLMKVPYLKYTCLFRNAI
jgi:hypothetical protein